MSAHLKTPLAISQNRFAELKIANAAQLTGKNLPCTVVSVSGSIVTVKFAVISGFTLPQVTIPILGSQYIRLPIKKGDQGVVIACDVRIGNVSGLGDGDPGLDQPGNLSALFFVPMGSKNFFAVDPSALVLYATPDCQLSVSPTGVTVSGPTGNLAVEGNLSAGNGITCTFTTLTGQVVQVVQGIVTGLSS